RLALKPGGLFYRLYAALDRASPFNSSLIFAAGRAEFPPLDAAHLSWNGIMTRKYDTWSPATLAAQALGGIDETTAALIPPLHTVPTYLRDTDNDYRWGWSYSGEDNPSYAPAEALLNELEGGAQTLLFASGLAAATAIIMALRPGDHVLASNVMYWSLRKWLLGPSTDWGLAVEIVDMTDLTAVEAALKPGKTKLVWAETPSNPLWRVTDIAAIAKLGHAAGAKLAVDSTCATPVLSQPIKHGADFVMHSATK